MTSRELLRSLLAFLFVRWVIGTGPTSTRLARVLVGSPQQPGRRIEVNYETEPSEGG
jgi:hypothetical protein